MPPEDRHMYGETLGQGPRFTLPRKVLLEHPRHIPVDATVDQGTVVLDYATMSRQYRMTLYDHICVCARCHYYYAGRFRIPSKTTTLREKKPLRQKAQEEDLTAAPQEEENRLTAEIVPLVHEEKKTMEAAPTMEAPCASPPVEKEEADESAAAVLRAAMDDIDVIHRRASVDMEHAMNGHLSASLFLSTVDKRIEDAEDYGAARFASDDALFDKDTPGAPSPVLSP